MIETIGSVFVVFYGIATFAIAPIGFAALAFMVVPAWPPRVRAGWCSLAGPLFTLVPGFLGVAIDTSSQSEFSNIDLVGTMTLVGILFTLAALISFPLALIVSRALAKCAPTTNVFE